MIHWLTATDNSRLTETAKFGYIPGLDGLRAIAVLIVMMNLIADVLYGLLDPRIRYD